MHVQRFTITSRSQPPAEKWMDLLKKRLVYISYRRSILQTDSGSKEVCPEDCKPIFAPKNKLYISWLNIFNMSRRPAQGLFSHLTSLGTPDESGKPQQKHEVFHPVASAFLTFFIVGCERWHGMAKACVFLVPGATSSFLLLVTSKVSLVLNHLKQLSRRNPCVKPILGSIARCEPNQSHPMPP